jgi:hypothetical protein
MSVNRGANHPQVAALLMALLAALVFGVSSASAETPAPGWTVDSYASPTNFTPSDDRRCNPAGEEEPLCDSFRVVATNAGSLPMDGSTVTLSDTLPSGVSLTGVTFKWSGWPKSLGGASQELAPRFCAGGEAGTPLRCTIPAEFFVRLSEVTGFPVAVQPDDTLTMDVSVSLNGAEPSGSLLNSATVSGGGAPEMSSTTAAKISSVTPPFGPANFNFFIAGADGKLDTQAGSHPYELTTTIDLNKDIRNLPVAGSQLGVTGVQDLKDVVVNLPLGFAGSTLAAPECTLAQLSGGGRFDGEGHLIGGGCPADTQVGHIVVEPTGIASATINSPIWNLVPEHGVTAEFGYLDVVHGSHVFYVHVVPTARGYVLQTTNANIPQIDLGHVTVTFFGDPSQKDAGGNAEVPFFTNPTGCASGPLVATIYMDSWQHPGSYEPDGAPDFEHDPSWVSDTSESPPVTGCNSLQFTPELQAQPTTSMADTPSGLEFELKSPQTESVGSSATPALKRAVVTLPAGMTVDPSAGNGLAGCSVAQIGWLGGSSKNFSAAQPECPEASKIGSLELTTPLIPRTLTGALYLANQSENPFGSVLGAYVVVDDPVTGVLLKIAGEFKTDPHTGQLTAVFDENPQLPFSDLKLHFFGGPRAELTTPESCGTFTTVGDLTPWSAPDSGPDADPFDSFTIDEACPNGFAPTFTAGSTNLQAGAYTPFVASFTRSDTDQELAGLSVKLPPGLLADVGSVPLCGEAQANAGTCSEATRVGTVTAGAGPGPNPLFVTGRAYLTGPYNGGPYGLSVVVPAIAGPFNFGNVIVRQSLRIDPITAQVTDVSDPFPTILDPTGANGQAAGIPIRLRRIDVSIDRPGFTFNPTNCGKLEVGGSIASTHGATSALATPFEVTNCQTLKFQPGFAVSTAGKTSKADGASLAVKLTYPQTAQGVEANLTRVKVDLPKQLPSRLTTLQKACTAKQFEANPAGCPAASVIGHAKAVTPILPVPLEGPAYFVSHGGEAFPSLVMVLQGNGVTLDLVGTTFISKAGITSSTFKTVPDAPVGSFELTLPEGRYSALAANGSLCASTLAMPTEFLAQNGAKINRSTPISVTGCAKKKALTRAQKLAAALKACHKDRNKAKRTGCETQARKRYQPANTKKKAKKK